MTQKVDDSKAVAIPKRHKKSCAICMLLDSEKDNVDFWVFKEGMNEEQDQHICNGCYEGIKEIRKKCYQKADNPKHDILKGFMPWFVKQVPGLLEQFTTAQVSTEVPVS